MLIKSPFFQFPEHMDGINHLFSTQIMATKRTGNTVKWYGAIYYTEGVNKGWTRVFAVVEEWIPTYEI